MYIGPPRLVNKYQWIGFSVSTFNNAFICADSEKWNWFQFLFSELFFIEKITRQFKASEWQHKMIKKNNIPNKTKKTTAKNGWNKNFKYIHKDFIKLDIDWHEKKNYV